MSSNWVGQKKGIRTPGQDRIFLPPLPLSLLILSSLARPEHLIKVLRVNVLPDIADVFPRDPEGTLCGYSLRETCANWGHYTLSIPVLVFPLNISSDLMY